MEEKNRKYWRILRTAAIILCLLTFTPLVIPEGIYKPELLGIPYSLWTSYLITIALVVLTYFGTKVHRSTEDEEVKP
jgi:hypothetical protein